MEEKIEKFLEKIKLSKEGKLDLSRDEDLSVAIMNLISIEEHFFFTGAKTDNADYYDLLGEIRQLRQELLKKIVKEGEGEVWCISKHLLAASMRLMEVGSKYLKQKEKAEAKKMFAKAFQLYSLFWGINLKILRLDEIKEIDSRQLNRHDKSRGGLTKKLGELIKKVIDCCIE